MSGLTPGDTLIVSDIHWQPATAGDHDSTGSFGRFLEELGARAEIDGPCTLYVLGDLFDFWFERNGATFPFYEPHIDLLRRVSARGVGLVLLYGNRDFTYGPALPALCGAEIAGDRAEIAVGDTRVLLQHGDLLCTDDRRYQRYRRFIRSPAVRGAMRLVSMRQMTRLIGWMRSASRAEIERKAPSSMTVVDDAVARDLAEGFDVVICGHVHRPERRAVDGASRSAELITLGAWDGDGGWYVSANHGRLELVRYG